MSSPARILTEAQRQAEAARAQIERNIAEKLIWADFNAGIMDATQVEDALMALRPTAVAVAPGPKKPAGREPGDEDEPPEAHTVGLRAVDLFLATEDGPVAVSSQEVKRAIAQALSEIREDGAPVLYLTAAGIARIGADDEGMPKIVPIEDGVGMRILIDQYLICGWVKQGKGGASVVRSNEFPQVAARMIELARPETWLGLRVKLPPLETVRSFPFFDSRFRLVNERGYHEETRCFLDRKTAIDPVPAGVSPVSILEDWLVDFRERSFKSPHDFTYAIAAFLTLLMRPGIDGPVPLFAVMASMVGTGKGYLVSALSLAAMGDTPIGLPLSDDEDRQKSEVLTLLRRGCVAAVVDNAKQDRPGQAFGGQAIESLLTEPKYSGRLLGTNDQATFKVRLMLFLTANNPRLTTDMLRRSIPISIGSTEEKASARGGWKRPDIKEKNGWTMRNRPRILGAAVAIVEAWRVRHEQGERWQIWKPGSYEAWASAVGSACVAAGLPGWGGGIDDFYDAAEPEDAAYRAWAAAVADMLHRVGGSKREAYLYTQDVVRALEQVEYWRTTLSGSKDEITPIKAWAAIKKVQGRSWSLPARSMADGEGSEKVRPACVLSLVKIKATSGVTAAIFEVK